MSSIVKLLLAHSAKTIASGEGTTFETNQPAIRLESKLNINEPWDEEV
jgi:hypothetical protein